MRNFSLGAAFALTALTLTVTASTTVRAQTPSATDATKTVKVDVKTDGRSTTLGARQAEVHQGRLYVPLRQVVEQLGYAIDWDPNAQTVVVTQGDQALSLPLGGRTTENGNAVDPGGPAYRSRGQIMVPLRFVAETLGAQVRWDAQANAVHISRNAATVGVGTKY